MSDRESTRPVLSVHIGKGERQLGQPFESSAKLRLIPQLPHTSNLRIYTSNPVMLDMFEAFQTSYEFKCSYMDVYYNRALGGFEFDPFRDNTDLDTDPTSHPDFTFNLSIPFHEQFPIDLIKRIKTPDDILEAFEEIEFERGELSEEALISPDEMSSMLQKIVASPYSEKFQQLERTFEEARDISSDQFCYIYLNDIDELEFTASNMVNTPHDIQTGLRSIKGLNNPRVVAAFDLRDNFESQINACAFDLEQKMTWKELVARPVDCVSGKMQTLLPTPEPQLHQNVVPFNLNP